MFINVSVAILAQALSQICLAGSVLLTAGALSLSTSASLDFASAPVLPHSMVLNLEMMSTVAATCAASNPIRVSGLTRSQIRRGKRKHTMACLIVGMQQQRVAAAISTGNR